MARPPRFGPGHRPLLRQKKHARRLNKRTSVKIAGRAGIVISRTLLTVNINNHVYLFRVGTRPQVFYSARKLHDPRNKSQAGTRRKQANKSQASSRHKQASVGVGPAHRFFVAKCDTMSHWQDVLGPWSNLQQYRNKEHAHVVQGSWILHKVLRYKDRVPFLR